MRCDDFPQRGHVAEFCNADPALGGLRAGTLNLPIRSGPLTRALIAQAVLHPLRQRLGSPIADGDARHLADGLFRGIEGDSRVSDATSVGTYDNAPNVAQLRAPDAGLPQRLAAEGIDPRIPWLYNFKLDFRFR